MDGPKSIAEAKTAERKLPGQDDITDKWQMYSKARGKWLDTNSKFAALASATGNKIRLVTK